MGVSISIIDVFKEELKIKSISAKKGHINIFVDNDHYSNTYVFSANSNKNHNPITIKVIDNDVDILIEDIEFKFTEKIKNKLITTHLNKLDFNIDISELTIKKVNLDILMKEMGLNLEKGTFFNNARCIGSFHPKFNSELNTIEVPRFDLKIGSQLFDVSTVINIKDKKFTFLLGLEKVNYTETKTLLPKNIKSRLEGFNILKPFKVSAKITGKFEYKNLTLVALQYETKDNEIVYKKDSLHLNNISFKGSFVNRFFTDSRKIENRKNYTFAFDSLSGNYQNIPFNLSNLSLKHSYSKPLLLATDFEAKGEIPLLNDLIKSKDYDLTNGTFTIKGSYSGVINSIPEILKTSRFNLKFNRLIVRSKDRLNYFNIPVVDLRINDNNATINNIFVYLSQKNRIQIQGEISNFSTLLTNNRRNIPVISKINITSNYLNFNSILETFGSQKKHSKSKNLEKIKKSINSLASKFNPNITINLQKLNFFDVPFSNINIKTNYLNNQINFTNLSGNYKDGGAKGKISIDLNPKKNSLSEEVLKVSMYLNVSGKIEHWAEMLHSDKFFFQDANYKLDLSLNDEVNTIFEIINRADITLNVSEGKMLYKPSNLTLPFTNISINISDNDAFLNDFDLSLPNQQSIHLKGKIINFTNLFDKSLSSKKITSSITVYSKDLNFSNFVDTFNPTSQKRIQKNNIKSILNDLYSDFKPTINLDLKKLNYTNVNLKNVKANLLFKNKNTLQIKNSSCYFYNKKLTLDAEIDISHYNKTQFTTIFSLDNFAIENLLSTFHNFGYKQLNKPTEISGIIKLKANFKGVIDDSKGVDFNSLNANINYNIKALNVKYFKPIIDAGNILFRKQRFENIKFANIKSSIKLEGNLITIPKTNIQSTAFDFFIEGVLDNNNKTDLWISVPLSNLKRRDLTEAPSRKSFKEAGRKIFLEIKADNDGELNYKLHLRNKKLKQ